MSDLNPDMKKDQFDWGIYPELEKFVKEIVDSFLENHSFARKLSDEMLVKTSTRFIDWIDYIALPYTQIDANILEKLGLKEVHTEGSSEKARVFRHMN